MIKRKMFVTRIRNYRLLTGIACLFLAGLNTEFVSASEKEQLTLKEFLQHALEPVGSTMYIWGGGWNEEDTGAGIEARSIGVSPAWKEFFEWQTPEYNYQDFRYWIHDGLDCSGYVGWCVYNTLETADGEPGYVMYAEDMASAYAGYGWGDYLTAEEVTDHCAGDIMSSPNHVWISLGECEDGSVVFVHASPPGVQISGSADRDGEMDSEANRLAVQYMQECFPEWYEKYPNCERGYSYLTDYDQMRWDCAGKGVLSDPEGYQDMSASEILENLFQK